MRDKSACKMEARSMAKSSKLGCKILQNPLKICLSESCWGPKSLKNQSWRGSGEVLGNFCAIFFNLGVSWGHLGAFWRRLEASWEHLGTFWERLGGVLGTFWGRLGLSWERLGAVLGAIRAVLGRLGVVLKSSWSALEVSWAILETTLLPENNCFEACHLGGHFSIRIFVDFASKNQARKVSKSLNSIEK